MPHIITGVQAYRAWNAKGTVVDLMTEQPRVFPSLAAAQSFVDLSYYGRHDTRDGIAILSHTA